METWQDLHYVWYREKIKQRKRRAKRKNTGNGKNRDNGRGVWFGDGGERRWKHRVREKCKKNILVLHFVQEQQRENQEMRVGDD